MINEFIHYGSNEFIINQFDPVENCGFVKPVGGLWASPVYTPFGWKEWCLEQDFHISALTESFKFTLFDEAKIYMIDNFEDLNAIPQILDERFNLFIHPDFEKLAIQYDAIWLTVKGQIETRHSEPINLYGWDCESILILKPNNIQVIYEKISY